MELPQDLQTTVIVGLLLIIRELIGFMWRRYQSESEEDRALSEERQQYTTLMQTMMTGYMDRLTELTKTVERGNTDLVAAMTTANETLARSIQSKFDQSLGHMTGVTQKRVEELARIRTDVKTIPAETRRVLNEDFKALPENTASIVVEQLNNVKLYLERVIDAKTALIDSAIKNIPTTVRAAIAIELEDMKRKCLKAIEDSKPITDDVSDSADKVQQNDEWIDADKPAA